MGLQETTDVLLCNPLKTLFTAKSVEMNCVILGYIIWAWFKMIIFDLYVKVAQK